MCLFLQENLVKWSMMITKHWIFILHQMIAPFHINWQRYGVLSVSLIWKTFSLIYIFFTLCFFSFFFCSINSYWVARKYTFLKHFEKLFCQYFSAGIKVLSSVFSSRITYDILSKLILWLAAIIIHWKCQWEEWFLDIFDF